MGQRQLPVIAVNLGKLGFLADISADELPAILGELCTGRLQVVEHLMFDCRVIRNGEVEFEQMGLNEIAVRTASPFLLMDIHLYVDSELVTTYSGDGLILSTPVGSTAYNLSAGGPILRKNLDAVVITPVSPHTLTMRPVVDSADRVYEMEVVEPHPETSAVVDGRVLCRLKRGDRIRVTRAGAVQAGGPAGPQLLPYPAREAELGRAVPPPQRSDAVVSFCRTEFIPFETE